MCLVVFAWDTHADYRLILAANRDEFHARPSRALDWWPDHAGVLAGRDLQAGGSWLAVHRDGRFATVTNYREQARRLPRLLSRGELVANFVAGEENPASYVGNIAGERYAGFSLLAGDGEELWYVSNRGDGPQRLEPGVYGLSNAVLDSPWPKLVRARDGLRSLLAGGEPGETALMQLMADRTPAPVADVDPGELPFAAARALTAPFIVSADYGTRCTTTLSWRRDGRVSLCERRFDAAGRDTGETRIGFSTGDQGRE
ncbi:MAG: NRDE family protein [Gammaproteobacteria bacterium]|nr:NRDE family protein [Gammaproteobacteria bacterium]